MDVHVPSNAAYRYSIVRRITADQYAIIKKKLIERRKCNNLKKEFIERRKIDLFMFKPLNEKAKFSSNIIKK